MSYKSEIKGAISNGATIVTMTTFSNGYINNLAFKFDTAATGTISLLIRKQNSVGVSTDIAFASKSVTAKTDVNYMGSTTHFEPGHQLVMQSNCGSGSYFLQIDDEVSALESWYEVVASALEETSSSSSGSSSSDSSVNSYSSGSSRSTGSSSTSEHIWVKSSSSSTSNSSSSIDSSSSDSISSQSSSSSSKSSSSSSTSSSTSSSESSNVYSNSSQTSSSSSLEGCEADYCGQGFGIANANGTYAWDGQEYNFAPVYSNGSYFLFLYDGGVNPDYWAISAQVGDPSPQWESSKNTAGGCPDGAYVNQPGTLVEGACSESSSSSSSN